MTWRQYLISIGWRTVVLASTLWVFAVLVDPFDTIAFSLPLDRGVVAPIDERHHPGLQTKYSFNGAVVGSSVGILFNPKRLGDWLGGSMINIGILAPEPWETKAMLELFLRRQPRPRYIVFELSQYIWCRRDRSPDGWKAERPPFQDWFFDDDPWNNLPFHFSLEVFDKIAEQLEHVVTGRGLMAPGEHHRRLPARPIDELNAVFEFNRRTLRSEEPLSIGDASGQDPVHLEFGDHDTLRSMFEAVPDDAHRIVVIAPLHIQNHPLPGSADAVRIAECKRRIVQMAHAAGRAAVLDAMVPSSLTREMRNFSDPLHLNASAADRFVDTIGATVRDGRPPDDTIRVLKNEPAIREVR